MIRRIVIRHDQIFDVSFPLSSLEAEDLNVEELRTFFRWLMRETHEGLNSQYIEHIWYEQISP